MLARASSTRLPRARPSSARVELHFGVTPLEQTRAQAWGRTMRVRWSAFRGRCRRPLEGEALLAAPRGEAQPVWQGARALKAGLPRLRIVVAGQRSFWPRGVFFQRVHCARGARAYPSGRGARDCLRCCGEGYARGRRAGSTAGGRSARSFSAPGGANGSRGYDCPRPARTAMQK